MKNNQDAAEITRNEKTCVKMTQAAFDAILASIGSQRPEQGGALGMNADNVITHFYFDKEASVSGGSYSPANHQITEVIRAWEADEIHFCGIIHSHPGTCGIPSGDDIEYADRILTAMPQTTGGIMHLPILIVDLAAGTAQFYWYIAEQKAPGRTTIRKADLMVDGALISGAVRVKKDNWSKLFLRNANLLPRETLSRKTVVIVGCGGARGFCESLARSAVKRFILIDGDTVSETNIGTQGAFVDEIGRPKTEVIANTLRRINPDVEIVEVRRYLDNSLSDDALEKLIGTKLLYERPEDVLLCGCTDNFAAQDRTVKLALNWGVPYLAAQVYAEGRAAEVVFTYPGITEACPRCMLASRYRAYEAGVPAAVTSESAPIYATERMNALKSHIAMMQLLYGTNSRIGAELELVKERNLVMMSFAADCEEQLGIRAFSRTLDGLGDDARAALPMEETVWLRQRPDRPENGYPRCPYCAGTGDLRNVRGLIADTRRAHSLTALLQAIEPTESSSEEIA